MQQQLPYPENDQWQNPVLEDLSFIRQHLRYPLNRRTSKPAVTMAVLLLVTLTIAIAMVSQFAEGITIKIIPVIAALIVVTLFAFRLLRSFYFTSVATGYTVTGNIELLAQFLSGKQLLVFHHPGAREIFQIISRPLDNIKGKREVMVFIADDKRILINSHFTAESGDAMQPVGATSHRQMAVELKKWIARKTAQENFTRIQQS